jgi:hypothetical protein
MRNLAASHMPSWYQTQTYASPTRKSWRGLGHARCAKLIRHQPQGHGLLTWVRSLCNTCYLHSRAAYFPLTIFSFAANFD